MAKSKDAFRTISEVSEWLDTPAHVLRFWESKFSQVKPVKRAGGRRYYRPADMMLLAGLKKLLHEDGLTIKGAQKILREKGVKHVAALSELSLNAEDDHVVDHEAPDVSDGMEEAVANVEEAVAAAMGTEQDQSESVEVPAHPGPVAAPDADDSAPMTEVAEGDEESSVVPFTRPAQQAEPETVAVAPEEAQAAEHDEPVSPAPEDDKPAEIAEETVSGLPSFITGRDEEAELTASAAPEAPVPLGADIPPDPTDDQIEGVSGPLATAARLQRLSPEHAARLAPVLEQLRARAGHQQPRA